MPRIAFGALLLSAPLLPILAGCFSPSLGDSPFECGATDPQCPTGYHCAEDNRCWRDGLTPPDAAPPPPDAPIDGPLADALVCQPGLIACEDDELVVCDGDAGETRTTCAIGCASAPSPHCQQLIPTNLDPALVPEATCASATEEDEIVGGGMTTNIDTGADCTFTQPQTGAPELCIVVRRHVMIAATATLRATGSRALVILATGNVTIDGTIDVSADGGTPGPGSAGDGSGNGGNGACPAGGLGNEQIRCGGGGGGHGGAGAAGAAGTDGGDPGGVVGSDPDLSPLTAGGLGGSNSNLQTVRGGHGGALQISACGTLTIATSAAIDAGGGGGGGGLGQGGASLFPASGGGGGGSGGGILLEAAVVTVGAGANLAANGGGGGGGGGAVTLMTPPHGFAGEDAVLGTLAADGGNPGIGSAGGGGEGGTASSPPSAGQAATDNPHGHGGGGGGVGRIRINSRDGQDLSLTGAILSPIPSLGPAMIQ